MNAAEIIAPLNTFFRLWRFFVAGTFSALGRHFYQRGRRNMDFGKGALLWLLGVPLPTILFLALFWRH